MSPSDESKEPPKVNTEKLTKAEANKMSCEEIAKNIDDIQDYIDYYEMADSAISMFSRGATSSTKMIVSSAKIKLQDLENLLVRKKCK